jgi:hypothetical protein
VTIVLLEMGLALELLGVCILAMPGFRQDTLRRVPLAGVQTRWWRSAVCGILVTCLAGTISIAVLCLKLWLTTLWLLGIVVSTSWLPLVCKWASLHVSGVGMPASDEDVECIHRCGLSLLAIGLAVQGLAATFCGG